jgi:hypothetical protein
MKSRDFARALADGLRGREITPPVVEEIVRCVASVHAGDDFVGPLARKLLGRHARRPGPKPNRDHQRKIAEAAIWARFNVRDGDKDQAARDATRQCGLSVKAEKSVYRAAFDRKDPSMNALIRRRAPNPESNSRGE